MSFWFCSSILIFFTCSLFFLWLFIYLLFIFSFRFFCTIFGSNGFNLLLFFSINLFFTFNLLLASFIFSFSYLSFSLITPRFFILSFVLCNLICKPFFVWPLIMPRNTRPNSHISKSIPIFFFCTITSNIINNTIASPLSPVFTPTKLNTYGYIDLYEKHQYNCFHFIYLYKNYKIVK